MSAKRTATSGLGQPEATGLEGLFEVTPPETEQIPVLVEQSKQEPPTSAPESNQQKQEKEKRVKTSVSLSLETLDLLQELKLEARRQEKQFISIGELMDEAVRDLAIKMGVINDQ